MSLCELEHSDIGECDVVLEVFYKAILKERNTKHLWIPRYDAPYSCLKDPTLWRLSVTGLSALRVGITTSEASSKFLSTALHELKAKGVLFKDERARGWVNDVQAESDKESVASCDSGAPKSMILYDAPPCLDDSALKQTLQAVGVQIEKATRMALNPGKPTGAAWRVSGHGLKGREGMLLHDTRSNADLTLISLSVCKEIQKYVVPKEGRRSLLPRDNPTAKKGPSYANAIRNAAS